MFECFVRSHNLVVWMLGFIPILVWSGKDVDWSLDLCYWLFRGVDFCFMIFYGVGGGLLWNF